MSQTDQPRYKHVCPKCGGDFLAWTGGNGLVQCQGQVIADITGKGPDLVWCGWKSIEPKRIQVIED